MPSPALLLQRMGTAEGLELHAFVIDAHDGRYARGVAIEVGERADHLRGDADIGDRELVAVAEAAGLLLAPKVALDRFQRPHGPVREPAVACRFVLAHLLLQV